MAKKTKTGLTKKHWFGYMFGDWGGCMTFALMASTFTMYCTNALGVDPTLLGTLVIIWTIWDAINDPMMGALMDKAFAKKQNAKGKFRPWLLRATPLLAVSAIALWTVPTFCDGITLLVVLFALKIFYEASYTMFNIPMGSLLSAMSTNDAERASLSSARGVGSMIGNMIPGMIGPFVINAFGDRETTGYMITGVVCALLGFIVCFMHYAWTEERTTVGEETKADDINFSDILVVIKKNRPFVALCIHGVCICLMQYAAQTLGMYMYSGVYHDVTYQSISQMLSAPFMIGSMIAVPFICKKLGLEKLIRFPADRRRHLRSAVWYAPGDGGSSPAPRCAPGPGLRHGHGLHSDAVGPGGRGHRLQRAGYRQENGGLHLRYLQPVPPYRPDHRSGLCSVWPGLDRL